MSNSISGVYLGQSAKKLKATLALLSYFRAFLRSEYSVMPDPIAGYGRYLNQEQARRKLHWLIHVAINRKAGILDVPNRKCTTDYQARLLRDAARVRDKVRDRVVVYQFETSEIRTRYAHLLSTHDEEYLI